MLQCQYLRVCNALFEIYNNMANYYSLPPQTWEMYAQEVCLAVDQKSKERAQKFFYDFVQTVHLDIILNLMQNGSDLLVFAIFSYINKNPQPFIIKCQYFVNIIKLVGEWQLHEFNFVRPGKPLFQIFVTKTIMETIGTMMKHLYENSDTSVELLKILQQIPLNFFKIYLLKTFIEIVEIVDTEMGYMRFRTMVYSFQDNVIPMICETLIPFFNNFQDSLRVNDLSAKMQSKLQVNESHTNGITEENIVSKQQEMQSQYVLMLLKKIVQFNYNITYTQYQSQQVIETCLITFPEKVAEKIINSQFLNSLFYAIVKVMESKVGVKKNSYLQIVLECLAKLMQARLGYVNQESKENFICAAIKGLTHLLRVCQQLQSQVLLQGILTCNKKLFMSVQMTYIQRTINKDPQARSQDLYNHYVQQLTWMILQVVRQSSINTENTLLNEALEVVNKIVANIGYKQFESMQGATQFYMKLLREITMAFVNNTCQPKYLFSTSRVIWLNQNKTAVNNMFEMFKKLGSYVFQDLFRAVSNSLDNYVNHQKHELIIFSNILFLLTQLVDRHFIDRNVTMNKAKDRQIAILALSVKQASSIVNEYASSRRNYLNIKGAQYLDIAVLLFCQALLIEFLSSFESTTSIKIKQKVYLLMIFGEQFNEEFQYQDTQSQSTIIYYLNIVFQFLSVDALGVDADVKMLYALQIVQRVVFKLKWNMRRETFLKSQIFKRLLSFFDDYFSHCYPRPQIMTKVGKIIVSLNFDDVLDQYKFRINKFIERLPIKESFGPVFYYLIGVFQGIEPGNIFKYFWGRLKHHMDMPSFFTQMFKNAIDSNTDKDYKDVCRLCKYITLSKGLRTVTNATVVYQIFSMVLPQLIWFLTNINNSHKCDIDLLGDAIAQIIEMFNGIINGTHVNIYLLDECSKNRKEGLLGQQYLYECLRLMTLMCQQIKLYPKLEEIIHQSFVLITKEILEYIYDCPNQKVPEVFSLFVLKIVDTTNQYVVIQLNGNRLIEDKLLKIVDGLRFFNQFINKKSKIIHKKNLTLSIKRYNEMSVNFQQSQQKIQNKIQKLIFYLVSLIMTNHKNNLSYIRTITKLLYELNKNYTNYIVQTFVKLQIKHHKVQEVHDILNNFREDMEQNFVEEFKIWIREFDQTK